MIMEPKPSAIVLDLDAGSIDPSLLSMGALMREINLRQRPPFLLRYMMNALENKRQKKLLGWSRPWNKIGMTVFRAHRHHPEMDLDYMDQVQKAFWSACSEMPASYRDFAKSVWNDPLRMAFTFYHNNVEGGKEYEGLTLSIGRKVPGDRTKRDRIDIILEDLRVDGSVDNILDRVRIIVNPFDKWSLGEKWQLEIVSEQFQGQIGASLNSIYDLALEFYRRYRDEPERQWNHWAFRYIEYFGPRKFIPINSAFI
jgi:hypothetical protein